MSDDVPLPNLPVPENDVDWDIGVRVTFNLWDSGAAKAAAYQAEERRRQAEVGVEMARQGIHWTCNAGTPKPKAPTML